MTTEIRPKDLENQIQEASVPSPTPDLEVLAKPEEEESAVAEEIQRRWAKLYSERIEQQHLKKEEKPKEAANSSVPSGINSQFLNTISLARDINNQESAAEFEEDIARGKTPA
jgi:hypothetical protein